MVAHGETAVAKRARHLCGGRAGGEEKREREREREQEPGERETSEEVDRGWYGAGQWLGGGISVKQGQPDRRKRGDGGVNTIETEGMEPDGGQWVRMGRDCLSVVMERETDRQGGVGASCI